MTGVVDVDTASQTSLRTVGLTRDRGGQSPNGTARQCGGEGVLSDTQHRVVKSVNKRERLGLNNKLRNELRRTKHHRTIITTKTQFIKIHD